MAEMCSWDTTDEEETDAPGFTLRIPPQQAGEEKDRKRHETVAVARLRLRMTGNNE